MSRLTRQIRDGDIDSGRSRGRRLQRACGPDRETGIAGPGAGRPAENPAAVGIEAAPADRCVSLAIDRRCAAVARRIAHRLYGRPERSAGAAVFADIDCRHRVQTADAPWLGRRAGVDRPLVGGRQINRLHGQRGRPVRTSRCECRRDGATFHRAGRGNESSAALVRRSALVVPRRQADRVRVGDTRP